ncbi:hypothetical protein [Cryptosporangium sp. NPDC048952]|uniref:type IV toxin-antitoxin system AbiEi family antitoxin domain-containing protein n=1 Tax=Cryptosporangium sp. NPDC048952 TaxID=3363961 RepID=UPI00371C6744
MDSTYSQTLVLRDNIPQTKAKFEVFMATDRKGLREALWQLASQQRGYFTAAQALKVGYSYQAQHFHVRQGNWGRVDRGVFRLGEYNYLPSEADDYLVQWYLWGKEQAVVSHLSALSVHEIGIANPADIHLTVPPGFRQRSSAVVLHFAELATTDVEQRLGYRITTPLRAIAECSSAGADQDVVDSAVADLLSRGEVTRKQLLEAGGRLGPRAELGIERALAAQP